MILSVPRAIASWLAALLEEAARGLLTRFDSFGPPSETSGKLPHQLDELAALLERTTGSLDNAMTELSHLLGGQMQQTLEHLDEAVSELRDTLTGLIGVIPGARRALSGAGPRGSREPT